MNLREVTIVLTAVVITSGCRGRGADGPDGPADMRAWVAPPGLSEDNPNTTWLRRVVGNHHDSIQFLDEPFVMTDPTVRVVFERVRGQLQPAEQRVVLHAEGGPNCSSRGSCRDRLTVLAGTGVGQGDPVEDGWALLDNVEGGEAYVPEDADEPVLVRFDGVVITAHGFDATRLVAVLDEIGAPPPRVQWMEGTYAFKEHSGGYHFRANPQAGHGRGIVKTSTWVSAGDGIATRNATIFEVVQLASQAAAAAGAMAPTIDGPQGALLHQSGNLVVTRSDAVTNVEQMFRPVGAADGGTTRNVAPRLRPR